MNPNKKATQNKEGRKPPPESKQVNFFKKVQYKIPRKRFDDDDYFYEKKGESSNYYFSRRDLVKIGMMISESTLQSEIVQELVSYQNECFESSPRPLILWCDPQLPDNSPKEKHDSSEESCFLKDDEVIPDWFEGKQGPDLTFDFGSAVNRGLEMYKERSHPIVKDEQSPAQEPKNDFDNILENQVEEMMLNASQSQIASRSFGEGKEQGSGDSEEENDVTTDYFKNLQSNIHKMLSDTFDQREETEGNISFAQERSSLDSNKILENSMLEPFYKPAREDTEYLAWVNTLPQSLQTRLTEFSQMTPEQKEIRKKNFMKSCALLNVVINKLVYDFLNSKQREDFNALSKTGFNQTNVENYCKNDYKIFSLYTRGNVMQKFWRFKNEEETIQGPFNAYDMDIWNFRGETFSKETKISFNEELFLPFLMFIERNPVIEWIVHESITKLTKNFQKTHHKKANPPKKVIFNKGQYSTSNHQKRNFTKRHPQETKIGDWEKNEDDIPFRKVQNKKVPEPEALNAVDDFPAVSSTVIELSVSSKKPSAWDEEDVFPAIKSTSAPRTDHPQTQNITFNIKNSKLK